MNKNSKIKLGNGSYNRLLRGYRRNVGAWVLILPFLFLVLITSWIPTIQGVVWSFFKMNGYNVGEFVGLENYRIALQDSQFTVALINTFKYVVWSIVIGYWLPVVIAIMLNEIKKVKGFFKFSIYFPQMTPVIAISMLWYYIYYPDASGLLNMVLMKLGSEPLPWLQNPDLTIILIVISNTWKGMGGTVLVYLAALQGVNRELYEAALVDGVGFLRRVFKITIPQISGILLINLVRQIVGIFQILEQPLAMTGGGPNGASISLGLLGYKYAFQNFQVGNALALNVVMFLILVVMSIVYFRVKNKVENDA